MPPDASDQGKLNRCGWATSQEMIVYHDREWGVPTHNDRLLFEFLILEGAQAGLSWSIVLNKRKRYRQAFANFDPRKVAQYGEAECEALLQNHGIIRNRRKIYAVVRNARAFVEIQTEHGTFDSYIWRFTGGKPIQNQWKTLTEIPKRTAESDAMSKDLRRRGFQFAGSAICYAFMQAVGMVNDHLVTCYRHKELR
jgi:DNA-3-methyladenine glycosylase I